MVLMVALSMLDVESVMDFVIEECYNLGIRNLASLLLVADAD